MSEKYTRRIDLDDLAEQLHDANGYQLDLESENRGLTSELKELKADLVEVRADYGDLVENRDAFSRLVQELERERDELRAQPANQDTVPRVITADELKPGQVLAVCQETANGSLGWFFHSVIDLVNSRSKAGRWKRIVLLEDAPAEEPQPVKVGDTINTVKELDGLADGSVVLDYFDDAHQKADGVWWEAAIPEGRDSVDVARYAPFTVLYLPEEDA